MKPLLLIPLAALVYAQNRVPLEIRGIVFEIGPNAPLAGAQVTIYQFDADRNRTVFASMTTDSSGAFRFNPAHPGDYYVEATKSDYFNINAPDFNGILESRTGALLTLNPAHPSESVRFALRALGELGGQVLDQDGKPVSGLMVELIPGAFGLPPAVWSSAFSSVRAERTGPDGRFHASKLTPGKYSVRVSPRTSMPPPVTGFSSDEMNAFEENFNMLFWPGVPDQASASVLTVNPGGVTDIGIMTVRTEPVYRIRLQVQGCEPTDQLNVAVEDGAQVSSTDVANEVVRPRALSQVTVPCEDLLFRGVRPGTYRFIATTKHSAGLATVIVNGRNVAASLDLIPNSDVSGRLVAPPGVPLPAQTEFLLQGRTRPVLIRPDAAGNFALREIECAPAPIQTARLSDGYYVKEVRVNETAANDGWVTLCGSSKLEIVLDNKGASLAITATDGDEPASGALIVFQRWPQSPLDRQQPLPPVSKSGSIRVTGLAPGNYRVMAARLVTLPDGLDPTAILSRLWDRATTIALGPGDAKNISVRLIDPLQTK